MSDTSEEEVFRIMQNINISKTAGIYNVSVKFLEDGAEILVKPLRKIFNLPITFTTFPNACKAGKLKPIFKRGKKIDPSNYRPFSLLPLIQKVLKRVIHDQINAFLKTIYYIQN